MAAIVGLREQINATATTLFPKATADYIAMFAKAGISVTDTSGFEVYVHPVRSIEQQYYQAILYCHAKKQVLATGDLIPQHGSTATQADNALGSLLKVLIDRSAKLLADAVGDDGRNANPNKVKWVSSEVK